MEYQLFLALALGTVAYSLLGIKPTALLLFLLKTLAILVIFRQPVAATRNGVMHLNMCAYLMKLHTGVRYELLLLH